MRPYLILAACSLALVACGSYDNPGSERESPTISSTPSQAPTEVAPPPPPTPEQLFDEQVYREGWEGDSNFSYYSGPAGYVQEICAEFDGPLDPDIRMSHDERMEVEWRGHPEMFEAGVPIFCPQHQDLLEAAKSGKVITYEQETGRVEDGRYLVPKQIWPGTYRTVGTARDCYWERVDRNGEIIDNRFVSIAETLTVTVAASDGGFMSDNCGTWQKVG